MKIRCDFVTNSSSSSFIINNKTSEMKDLIDFLKENPSILNDPSWKEYKLETPEEVLEAARKENIIIRPGLDEYSFGNEIGDRISTNMESLLRDVDGPTVESGSFSCQFHESHH